MPPALRIALVVTGGLDRSARTRVIPALLALVARLARRHRVNAYVLRYHARSVTYPLLGATVRDLGSPSGVWAQYRALMRALNEDGPFDIIHGYWALPAGLVAAAAGRRLGVPSLITLDSGELVALPDIEYGLQRRWRQRLAVAAATRLASRVTVCTGYMHRLARARRLDPDVLPLGVDSSLFTPGRPPAAPPWRLLHVGRLHPVKDQATLLEAFRRVRAEVPSVHLDIVGEDTMGGHIQRLARDLNVSDAVTFQGLLPSEAVASLYQRAHLLVLSSRHEAAGVVALEAACCGVPVVGTHVGYLADWTPDRAATVAPADPKALAAVIVALLSDEATRARLAEAAQRWARAHDVDWTAAQLDALYRQLVPRR